MTTTPVTTWRRALRPTTAATLAALLVAGLGFTQATPTKIVVEEFFFHGEPTDQVNKQGRLLVGVTDTPLDSQSPTFDQEPPTGDEAVVQQPAPGVSGANQTTAGGALSVYWVGDLSGEIDGTMSVRWFWMNPSPSSEVFSQVPVDIRVWADPNWQEGTGTLIGQLNLVQLVAGSTPTLNETAIPVKGTVKNQLVIQVMPRLNFVQETPLVLYDSADFDSGFTVPFRVPCEPNDSDPACK